MIAYTNYDEGIENLLDDEPVYFRAEDQTWDGQTMRELWEKYHVYYNRGIWGYMVIPRKTGDPLIVIGYEDDGCIRFPRSYGQYEHSFSAYWIKSILKDFDEVQYGIKHMEVKR